MISVASTVVAEVAGTLPAGSGNFAAGAKATSTTDRPETQRVLGSATTGASDRYTGSRFTRVSSARAASPASAG